MKKLLFTILLSVAAGALYAAPKVRPIQLGVRAGLFYPTLSFKDPLYGGGILSADGKPSFTAGFIARINTPFISIQPEIIYTGSRYDLRLAPSANGDIRSATLRINSYDVPVLLTKNFAFLRLYLGPRFNVSVDSKTDNNDFTVLTTTPRIGYTAGAAVKLGKISVEGRYNGAFARSTQSIYIAGGGEEFARSYKTSVSGWSLGIGLAF